MTIIFISFVSFVAEGYLDYSASAIAANTLLRSLFAAAFPLFSTNMYQNIKPEWASTILGKNTFNRINGRVVGADRLALTSRLYFDPLHSRSVSVLGVWAEAPGLEQVPPWSGCGVTSWGG